LLHAVIHNKKAQERGDAWTLEDNVTSTFFGPLCFLPVEDTIELLGSIFPSTRGILSTGFKRADLQFWQRIRAGKNSNRSGKIEPDLMILFKYDPFSEEIDLILLVEVKWKGYKDERDKHQVHEQIDAIKTHLKPIKMQAIYLTQFNDRVPNSSYAGVQIDCVKWGEVANRLHSQLRVSTGALEWKRSSLQYLEKMLGNVFHGFSSSNFHIVPELSMQPMFFSSFRGFSAPPTLPSTTKFFSGEIYE